MCANEGEWTGKEKRAGHVCKYSNFSVISALITTYFKNNDSQTLLTLNFRTSATIDSDNFGWVQPLWVA